MALNLCHVECNKAAWNGITMLLLLRHVLLRSIETNVVLRLFDKKSGLVAYNDAVCPAWMALT